MSELWKTFNAAADRYTEVRPGYPDVVFEAIGSYGGLGATREFSKSAREVDRRRCRWPRSDGTSSGSSQGPNWRTSPA